MLINTASNGESRIILTADGKEIYSLGLSAERGENQLLSFEADLNGANELTIKMINDDPNSSTNAIMWDITLTEVNTGQKN
ncbi:hypothetical protein GK047_07360 [Paenibacillus sp. SYP-B3998]|uniref:Uncharacterized protein n=1 Tax=Paenibacillus sp. SYP-B3998 TaxID=2678564 RepID=A0A6G3ZUP2_9BACL|nr:hypothetical protein [Paenibacillus sp. SYP-B3998]NEW05835.1 hypothetical protein [Paenibacillus sp. SYP-B3998]